MDEIFLDELRMSETDVDGALKRLSGDRELYGSILDAFLQDPTMDALEYALHNKMWDEAFTAAHALKGLAGNLGFTPLFHSVGELIILIRSGRVGEIGESLKRVRRYYNDIVLIIRNDRNAVQEIHV